MYMRPVQSGDLKSLCVIAKNSGVGVTSLPDNERKMQAKLDHAINSFNQTLPVQERLYLFALIDDDNNDTVAGICALEASIGNNETWYNYHVGKSVHYSREIGVHKTTKTLYLSNDMAGNSEIATLFLMPEYRNNQNGQLLSRSRYLFLADHLELFSSTIFAEMRGYSDEHGQSPFWESLGRHFFQMEFPDADYLTGLGNKVFIAELMPKFPIYVPMLSEQAQAVIGTVHPQTEPALAMLKSEGFDYNNYIDIFDGGPSVAAKTKDIRAVKESRIHSVVLADDAPSINLAEKYSLMMVSNQRLSDYRVIMVNDKAAVNGVLSLSVKQAKQLNVKQGDPVRAVALRPQENNQ